MNMTLELCDGAIMIQEDEGPIKGWHFCHRQELRAQNLIAISK